MSVDALEQAFYFALGQAQQGVPLVQIQQQLAGSGWQPPDIEHILYRVNQQLNDPRTQPSMAGNSPLNNAEARTVTHDGGHVSKALRQIVLNSTDQTLDLDKVNFMGPIMLVSGGMILLGGLLGLALLIAYGQTDSVKSMIFPVVIGGTFIKAGIDTYLKNA